MSKHFLICFCYFPNFLFRGAVWICFVCLSLSFDNKVVLLMSCLCIQGFQKLKAPLLYEINRFFLFFFKPEMHIES